MDYDKIHNELAEKYGISAKQIQHIRTSCIGGKRNREEYEKMCKEKLTHPANRKKRPRRRLSKKWYTDMLSFMNSIGEPDFIYIINYGR